MGLDNGIIIKNLPVEDYIYFRDIDVYEEDNEVEICYWRKCWNVRDAILKILKTEVDNKYIIKPEDIPAIIRKLEDFLIPSNWEEGNSIWLYDEIVNDLINDIVNLSMLLLYMKLHPESEIEIYFYDSY